MYRKYVALLDIPKSRIKSRPTNKKQFLRKQVTKNSLLCITFKARDHFNPAMQHRGNKHYVMNYCG